MCGRYTWHHSIHSMFELYDIALPDERIPSKVPPRYNIAPMQFSWVITSDGLKEMRWGLIPIWAKDESFAAKSINARAETLREKASFKNLISHHRILVPASSFYEWKQGEVPKQPYNIHHPDDHPMAFAGFWSRWQQPNSPVELHTYTIITTAANKAMLPYHERMPLILDRRIAKTWPHQETPKDRIDEILANTPTNHLEFTPVSTRVNSVRNDDESLLEQVLVQGSGLL